MYVYCKIIYRTGIRPNEILDLKPANIDYNNLQITIDAEFAKDDDDRFVAVDAELMTDILHLTDKCGPNDYIFSTDLLGNYIPVTAGVN